MAGKLVHRHPLWRRIWHWTNALTVLVMVMSGLMIFNAHPRLYWGQYGANPDPAWMEIGSTATRGYLRIGTIELDTTGFLGRSAGAEEPVNSRAFPGWMTIPSFYSLSDARRWHLAFAWIFVLASFTFCAIGIAGRHVQDDLIPTRDELSANHLITTIADHARLKFPTGLAALRYNVLQQLSYLLILFGIIPMLILTGLAMSPGMNAAWPWLTDVFGGRQSARSIHFIFMTLMVLFIFVHLVAVILAGPFNELRSMITGTYRIPQALRPELKE